MHFKNILCPIDYSSASQAALEKATRLARKEDAHLHIVNVYEVMFMDGYMEGMTPVPVTPNTEAIKKRLEEFRPTGVKLSHELIFGFAASSIVQYAQAKQIDLIVMATHSKSVIERWFLGSVTESVMRVAPCPVLVVHDQAAIAKASDPVAEPCPGITYVF